MRTIYKTIENNIFFYAIAFLVILWHIATLAYNPLPWFDETFFASIAKSLAEGRGFLSDISPLQTGEREVLSYGPVYFSLTALSFNLFGISAFTFRIVALVFSALSIVATGLIMRQVNVSHILRRTIIILMIFDNMIRINSHTGRMDMVAMFFVLMAFYFYLSKQHQTRHALMALSGTLALLTTPRAAIFLIPLFATATFSTIHARKWTATLTIIFIPFLLYSSWIFFGFGGYEDFLSYYMDKGHQSPDGQEITIFYFIGGNFLIHYFQWPIVISALFFFFRIHKPAKRSVVQTSWLFFTPILFYYLLVFDTGQYSAMVMPFWYLLLAWGIHHFEKSKTNPQALSTLKPAILGVLFIINTGLFSLKAIQSLGAFPQHDPAPVKKWIDKHLPPNSKVVGDDRFYYACVRQQSDLQYIYRPQTAAKRALYHAKNYKPDYLLLCNETKTETIKEYRKRFIFEETLHFTPPDRNKTIDQILKKLPGYINTNYEAWLIKVRVRSHGNSNDEDPESTMTTSGK